LNPGRDPAFPTTHPSLPRRHLVFRAVILVIKAVGNAKKPASCCRRAPSSPREAFGSALFPLRIRA